MTSPAMRCSTSLANLRSLRRTASSTAISSKGFIECLTPSVTTPRPSGFTRICQTHTLVSLGTVIREQTGPTSRRSGAVRIDAEDSFHRFDEKNSKIMGMNGLDLVRQEEPDELSTFVYSRRNEEIIGYKDLKRAQEWNRNKNTLIKSYLQSRNNLI